MFQLLAKVGAVLSMLDGTQGCGPACCVVWFLFRMMRRYFAHRSAEVGWVYRLLEMLREGCPVHGLVHLLVAGAAGVGFRWNPHMPSWARPRLPGLCNLAGPIQHYRSATLECVAE